MSLWPLRYLVVEWSATSIPKSSGRCRYGVANVLSHAEMHPWRRAMAAMPARSVMVSSGLTPPDPSKIENYGHLIIQALVALVTIWATVRKALQRPQEVVPVEKVGDGGNVSNGNGAE